MRRFLPSAASACLLCCLPALLSAADPSDRVGQEVMVRSAQAVLRKEPDEKSEAVAGSLGGRIYKVRAAEGSWIQPRQVANAIDLGDQPQHAIRDYSEAIRLAPDLARAVQVRGAC
ncbi:MAG TPA: hypothetical protein VGN42_24725 [Pirellulales bacterium]|nr:hypothetical protein [Pirellulales bacterium]